MPNRAAAAAHELPPVRRRLLAWFSSAKRDLPWRRTRDPYRIWLSEIMLQQTRVAAVVPYYERFLDRFPTVHALARARSDTVLRHWAGLGYYSRARNLHRAAKDIVARHESEFPRSLDAALALPGIGRYTAAAVLSIAYGEPHAVLDGNVARVLARLDAVRGDLRRPRIWRALQARADALLDPHAPGDWNQAMMELGATLCTPQAPRCDDCPLKRRCRAHALGLAESLPAARRKAAPVRLTLAAAILLDPRGRTLLLRGKNSGRDAALFSRMWQFPAVRVEAAPARRRSKRPSASAVSRAFVAGYLRRAFGVRGAKIEPLPVARHTVTFREIRLVPFLARVARLPDVSGGRTLPLAAIGRLPVSSATRKLAGAGLIASK
jgi:A/G-specific adenine glycosylase